MLDILCLHGINTNEASTWLQDWGGAIEEGSSAGDGTPLTFNLHPWLFNAHFAKPEYKAGGEAYATAFKRLWDSLWTHGYLRAARADQMADRNLIARTMGMVVQWVAYPALRRELRASLKAAIVRTEPHVVLAHSLGSLVAYDLLLEEEATGSLMTDRVLITLGSQIGHPALRQEFGGKLDPLRAPRHWFHLFNENDAAFTAALAPYFTESNFTQVDVQGLFWSDVFWNHAAPEYLRDEAVAEGVWPQFVTRAPKAAPVAPAAVVAAPPPAPMAGHWFQPLPRVQVRKRHPRRALLIGINAYPQPEDRLSGCVNDVFLMSSVLQERGFDADDIRVVLDDRATTAGVLKRLEWLLDGVCPGDERVLFYSGHGAQVPAYNADGEPDHKRETLVTWDFDWEANLGIADADLAQFYANLPYDVRLAFVLDCCHSGGIARAGGSPKVKGLDPPDDVRHRAIEWDPRDRLWKPRKRQHLKKMMSGATAAQVTEYLGEEGDTVRIGRGIPFWHADPLQARRLSERLGHKGPYNPMVLAACQEKEYAYEYRDGAASYGAMTYVLAKELRRSRGRASVQQLVEKCNAQITALELQQTVTPHVPSAVKGTPFPGDPAGQALFDGKRARPRPRR